jgi:hypothetical protein
MEQADMQALLAPFRQASAEAEAVSDTGALLMRAALQVREREDAERLRDLAQKCYAEAVKMRKAIPQP